MPYLIEASNIFKEFRIGPSLIHALNGIDFFVTKGEFVAIMGTSGSGKSTLLHILGCLERPTSGRYLLDSVNVFNATDRELSNFRANNIGFVFQNFNLVPQLDVYENVELPFLYSSFNEHKIKESIMNAINHVGLTDRIYHKPSELSGGQMQRAAIARALAIEPTLILADEPTGNLDTNTSLEILDLFKNLNDKGTTILMVTHDNEVAYYAQQIVTLKDGQFV